MVGRRLNASVGLARPFALGDVDVDWTALRTDSARLNRAADRRWASVLYPAISPVAIEPTAIVNGSLT
jgi:hypothetical protein